MNPNDVIGQTIEKDYWLAPDWSSSKLWREGSSAPGPGWTRVSTRESLYANGRRVTEVLDENRQPIKTRTLAEEIDKDQEKRFQDAQRAAAQQQNDEKPPSGITERVVSGRRMGWNPQTRAYDVDLGPVANQDIGPPSGRPYIDDGPEAGPSGRRWGWNPATKAYDRDLGPSPSAQKPPPKRESRVNPNDATRVQELDPTTGQWVDAGPNDAEIRRRENEARTEAERNRPQGGSRTLTRNGKTYIEHTIKTPGKPDEVYYTDQAGTRVELPEEKGKSPAFVRMPPGVPEFRPDFTQPDLGLRARRRQLDELIASGVIPDEATALQVMEFDRGMAVTEASNQGALVNVQEGNRTAALNARTQDVTDASSRRSFAGSTFNQALSTLAPIGSAFIPGEGSAEAAAAGFLATLGLAREHAAKSGGMTDLKPYDLSAYPYLHSMGAAGMPGLPGGPPLPPGIPGVSPAAPSPSAAPAPPNAIGVPAAPPSNGITINVTAPGGAPPQPVTGPDGVTRSPDGTAYEPGKFPPPGQMYPSWFTPTGQGGAAQALMQSAGAAAGYDPLADPELADIWTKAGFDADVLNEAFEQPKPTVPGGRLG